MEWLDTPSLWLVERLLADDLRCVSECHRLSCVAVAAGAVVDAAAWRGTAEQAIESAASLWSVRTVLARRLGVDHFQRTAEAAALLGLAVWEGYADHHPGAEEPELVAMVRAGASGTVRATTLVRNVET